MDLKLRREYGGVLRSRTLNGHIHRGAVRASSHCRSLACVHVFPLLPQQAGLGPLQAAALFSKAIVWNITAPLSGRWRRGGGASSRAADTNRCGGRATTE